MANPPVAYKILNQKNPEYCGDFITKLQLLYEGSEAIQENIKLFLPRSEARKESHEAYAERIKCVAYRPYMCKIINDFNSELFQKSFSVLPAADASDTTTLGDDIQDGYQDEFYKEFARNADLKNHSIGYVVRQLSQQAMVTKKAYLGVDFPRSKTPVLSLGDQESLGLLRAYVYNIPTLSVIDWECDELGQYKWLILKNEECPRTSVLSSRSQKRVTFKIWQKEPNGKIIWNLYEILCDRDKEPSDDDMCRHVDSGDVSFKQIPVLCYEVPQHLWIGGLIGNMQIEHFKRNSELVWSKKRSLFSVPVMYLGAEMILGADGNPSELNSFQQDDGRDMRAIKDIRSKGIPVLGKDDDIRFAEPSGEVYKIEEESLDELVNSMHAIVNQMGTTVKSQSRDLGRSGLSKMIDNHAKELTLAAYAAVVKEFGPKLYKMISDGRTENILWRVVGMEDFKFVEMQDAVNEALALGKVPWDMSKTLLKHLENNLSLKLAGDIPAETQQTIKKEIDEHVDAMSSDEVIHPTQGQIMQNSNDNKDKNNGK